MEAGQTARCSTCHLSPRGGERSRRGVCVSVCVRKCKVGGWEASSKPHSTLVRQLPKLLWTRASHLASPSCWALVDEEETALGHSGSPLKRFKAPVQITVLELPAKNSRRICDNCEASSGNLPLCPASSGTVSRLINRATVLECDRGVWLPVPRGHIQGFFCQRAHQYYYHAACGVCQNAESLADAGNADHWRCRDNASRKREKMQPRWAEYNARP